MKRVMKRWTPTPLRVTAFAVAIFLVIAPAVSWGGSEWFPRGYGMEGESRPSHPQQQAPARQRTAEEYIELLETERRVSELQVDQVIASLGVREGMRIADLGSGSGLFTRPLAKQVGSSGVVYAVDVDEKLLDHVLKTSTEKGLTNVRPILADANDAQLPEPVDLITIIDTLHHIPAPSEYVKGLRKYLRKGGRVAIIDFSNEWPAGHESMVYQLKDLEKWMKDAKFKRVQSFDFLDNNFFVLFQ
jgi:2-polyprenyl-3-methyl-5-hydroxy-6-metoxy-1,4-benzoquinol methylase